MPRIAFVLSFAVAALVAAPAHAQAPARIRGTIVSVDAMTMVVKSRDGRDLVLKLADNLGVAVAKAARFEDIQPGDYVGTATRKNDAGDAVALEVHYLAPTTPPGQLDWDLAPNTRMTNANVASKVIGTAGRLLLLKVGDGEQKVVVPDGIPIVRAVPGTRADLVPGEYVFLAAQAAADGSFTAQRIQVSKDGVRPPQ